MTANHMPALMHPDAVLHLCLKPKRVSLCVWMLIQTNNIINSQRRALISGVCMYCNQKLDDSTLSHEKQQGTLHHATPYTNPVQIKSLAPSEYIVYT